MATAKLIKLKHYEIKSATLELKQKRETRFELATSSLARKRSTTELFPHVTALVRTNWWARGESNPYTLRHWHLKPACLPFHHSPEIRQANPMPNTKLNISHHILEVKRKSKILSRLHTAEHRSSPAGNPFPSAHEAHFL